MSGTMRPPPRYDSSTHKIDRLELQRALDAATSHAFDELQADAVYAAVTTSSAPPPADDASEQPMAAE